MREKKEVRKEKKNREQREERPFQRVKDSGRKQIENKKKKQRDERSVKEVFLKKEWRVSDIWSWLYKAREERR